MSERRIHWPSAVLVCALALTVLFGYAIARPATDSMFLAAYDATHVKFAWVAVAATVVVVVAIYNRAAARFALGWVMFGTIIVSALLLALLVTLHNRGSTSATFMLYVWRDVHIVMLLEALWSFANLVFPFKTARFAYGIFCAAGSIGGIAGNLAVGELAKSWGTDATLWLLMPIFAIDIGLVWMLARAAGHPAPPKKGGLSDIKMLRDSAYLLWMLALISLVQVVITLIDYSYIQAIAAEFPQKDERTVVLGRVYAAIDSLSLMLQLATFAVLRLAGVKRTLIAIPALLAMVVTALALVPRLSLIMVTKIASKVFDYSLFRAAKEMLYIPLTYAEKTRGKAIVDMLTYRVAKIGASLLLVPLEALGLPVIAVTLPLIAAWLAVTFTVTRRYEAVIESPP